MAIRSQLLALYAGQVFLRHCRRACRSKSPARPGGLAIVPAGYALYSRTWCITSNWTGQILRSDAEASKQITTLDCILGYIVTLIGVPAFIYFALIPVPANFPDTPNQVAANGWLAWITLIPLMSIIMLAYSFYYAWAGALLSIPVVIWARRCGYFGWGVAASCGIAVMLVVWALTGAGDKTWLPVYWLFPPSAFLGLSYWLTVRLIRPQAFAKPQTLQNDASAP